MNPALVTNYEYPTGDSWYNSTGYTWVTRLAYYVDTAEATWTFAAAEEAGTFSFTYKTGYSGTARNKLSLIVYVNGEAVQTVSEVAATTAVTVEQEVSAGDVVKVYAKFELLSASYSYAATLVFTEAPESSEIETCTYRGSVTSYDNATGGIGGWESSEMRTYLQETIKPLIPETVRTAIKTVYKTQTAYNTSGSSYSQTTEDDVWIPDYTEVYGTGGTSGTYKAIYNSDASRIKYKSGATSAAYWWLRRAINATAFHCILTSGAYNNYGANSSYGVVLGFCT